MKFSLSDLIDLQKAQALLSSFCNGVGISAAIADLKGKILVGSQWQRICTEFHRVDERACIRCIESDTVLAGAMDRGKPFSIYRCKNGLTDAVSPIVIEGEHVANVFVGQFLLEPPNVEFFKNQAHEFGFDEDAYLEALLEVPVLSEDRLPSILSFLTSFAEMVAGMGLERLRHIKAERELQEVRSQLEMRVRIRTQELQRVIEELKESEERFRLIAETIQAVFWMSTPGFSKILYVSPAYERIWGRSIESLYESPRSFLDAIHQDDRERVISQAMDPKESKDLEYRIVQPDGSVRWIQDRAFIARDAQGNIRLNLGVATDITERKEAEQGMAVFAAIVESSSDAIIGKTLGGIITSWNHAAERVFGYREVEAVGKPISIICPPDVINEEMEMLKKVARGDGIEDYETVRVRKSGERFNVSVTISPIKDSTGEVVGASSINRDITSRKHAEEALRQSRGLLEKTFESLNDAIFLLDPQTRKILSCNHSVKDIFGYTDGELIGQSIESLHLNREMFEAFGRMMSSALEREGVFKTEFQMRRRDGRVFPTEHSVTEVTDDSGRRMSIVSVIRDISERKKAEDELKKYMGKLEQSNRDLEDFAYVASHDLQEPLRKIQAFGDRLKAKYGAFLGDEGINFIDRMQNASRRMQDLIRSILKYSRVATRGEPFIPVNLNEIVRDVVADLEARIEQTGGKVEVDTLPVIDADPSQMRQLFQNLIGNALKYIHAAEQPSIRIYVQKGDQECRVFVEDNGIGFDEKHLERIFRPFQRLHGRNEYEGTGMGLAIVKKIVSRHDGEVTARSAPGKGSTFIVTLPLHQSEGEMREAANS